MLPSSVILNSSPTGHLGVAIRTLEAERRGLDALISALSGELGSRLQIAVQLIWRSQGRLIITGMGKSGHIGRKIAATCASIGTPAYFVHPGEASHGDLGMIASTDVILALSWSGETAELKNIVSYSRRVRVPLIALTSRNQSALGMAADVVLELPASPEACPNGLAPTTSTLVQLAIGDALAMCLLEMRGITTVDFGMLHPGGKLGAQLQRVSEVMHQGDRLPLVRGEIKMAEALIIMTEKRFGCLAIVDDEGNLEGIITDGDLRRHMRSDLLSIQARDIMTLSPHAISPATLVSEALALMNSAAITSLLVTQDCKPIGIIHIHDLLRIGVA
jgi:arabinose-5-phosphate isomerase